MSTKENDSVSDNSISESSPVIDELIQSFSVLAKVRRKASQLILSSGHNRSSLFASGSQETKRLRSMNELVAAGKTYLISQIRCLYGSSQDSKIWLRVLSRISEAVKSAPGVRSMDMSFSMFSNAQQLHTLMNDFISVNRQMIRSVYQNIYSYELERTCKRRSNGRLARTSKLPCSHFKDLIRLVEYRNQMNQHVTHHPAPPLSAAMQQLQLEYDATLEQNILNLQKGMLGRNRLVRVSIDQYACQFYSHLQRNCRSSSSSQSSLEEIILERQPEPEGVNAVDSPKHSRKHCDQAFSRQPSQLFSRSSSNLLKGGRGSHQGPPQELFTPKRASHKLPFRKQLHHLLQKNTNARNGLNSRPTDLQQTRARTAYKQAKLANSSLERNSTLLTSGPTVNSTAVSTPAYNYEADSQNTTQTANWPFGLGEAQVYAIHTGKSIVTVPRKKTPAKLSKIDLLHEFAASNLGIFVANRKNLHLRKNIAHLSKVPRDDYPSFIAKCEKEGSLLFR